MSRISLNNVDLAWLRMESPTNPMMITVAVHFRGRINYDQLIANLKVSLVRYRRFRQRIVRPRKIFSRPYWEDSPNYRVEDHVELLDLPSPADDTALQEAVNKKMNTTLDFAHPLWKLTVVDNYPEGSVIIVSVHHCIADGISLVQVLLQMALTSNIEPVKQSSVDDLIGNESQAEREPAIIEIAQQDFDRSEALQTISPSESPKPTSQTNRGTLYTNPPITEIIAAAARIIFRRPDPPTILKGRLGKIKKVVSSEPFSLPEIKRIAQINHATINDILMAVASGAIQRYLDLHNEKPKRNIRAFILVNMRGRSIDEELGNKFGLVFLTLPLDRKLPQERLGEIKQSMDRLKMSAEYAATYVILNILGWMPGWIEHLATLILDTKGTVVATNVPGPRQQLYLAGAPITSIEAWVPQSGRIGVGLSFVSYNDQMFVGLNVDAELVPDPEIFLKLFTEEFESFQADLSVSTLE